MLFFCSYLPQSFCTRRNKHCTFKKHKKKKNPPCNEFSSTSSWKLYRSRRKKSTTNNLISWHAFLRIQLCVLALTLCFLAIWPENSHWINIIAVNAKKTEKRQRIQHNPSLSLSLLNLIYSRTTQFLAKKVKVLLIHITW